MPKRLDPGGALPGDDTFGALGLAKDVDQPCCTFRIVWVGQQQGGEVVPEGAAGADAAAVELAFVAAAGAVEVVVDAGARCAPRSSLA